MDRAFARLPKDPETGKPFRRFGLTAPISAFRRLGDGVATYMFLLHSGGACAVIACLLAIPPIALNGGDNITFGPDGHSTQGTLGGAARLSWAHVLCDGLTSLLCVAFVGYQQRRFVRPVWRSARQQQWRRASVDIRANPRQGEEFEATARAPEDLAGLKLWLRGSPTEVEPAGASNSYAALRETMAEIVQWLPLRLVPLVEGNDASGKRLDAAAVVSACSVVLWGWPRGSSLPRGTLAPLSQAAGGVPLCVLQCVDITKDERETERRRWRQHALGRRLMWRASDLDAPAETEAEIEAEIETCPGGVPYVNKAFVTFATPTQARRVVVAAQAGALWPQGGLPDGGPPPHVGHAPNPLDVRWEALGKDAGSQRRRRRQALLMVAVLIPLSALAHAAISWYRTFTRVSIFTSPHLFAWTTVADNLAGKILDLPLKYYVHGDGPLCLQRPTSGAHSVTMAFAFHEMTKVRAPPSPAFARLRPPSAAFAHVRLRRDGTRWLMSGHGRATHSRAS